MSEKKDWPEDPIEYTLRVLAREESEEERTRDAAPVIRDLQERNPRLTLDVLAEICEVTPNTVARWAAEKNPLRPERDKLQKLVLLRAQGRCPYTFLVPAILGVWTWPRDLTDRQVAELERLREAEFFGPRITADYLGRIMEGPRAPGHYWRYTLTLNASFESLTFFSFGPDRSRARLHAYEAAPASGDTKLRFYHEMRIPPSQPGKRSAKVSLEKGSELPLYVSYRG